MTDEIDLKLSLPAIVAGKRTSFSPAKIAAACGVQSSPARRPKHLVWTYFDTEDEWLRQHHMALRIRKIGRQRIQPLKAPAGEVAGGAIFFSMQGTDAAGQAHLALV